MAGIPAPLFYASPTQINFQVPYGAIPQPADIFRPQLPDVIPLDVAVSTASGASVSTTADGTWSDAEIFTVSEDGCGHGAILNIAHDGSMSLNSPSNSASPGDFVAVYATGRFSALRRQKPLRLDRTPCSPSLMR